MPVLASPPQLLIHATHADGASFYAVQLDTSTPGARSGYTVIGHSDLTSTATRTVANDNAAPTSTEASSTPEATNDNTPIVPLAAIGTDPDLHAFARDTFASS